MEDWFDFISTIVELGFGFYTIHKIFSKNAKKFHCSVNKNGFELDSEFYNNK